MIMKNIAQTMIIYPQYKITHVYDTPLKTPEQV